MALRQPVDLGLQVGHGRQRRLAPPGQGHEPGESFVGNRGDCLAQRRLLEGRNCPGLRVHDLDSDHHHAWGLATGRHGRNVVGPLNANPISPDPHLCRRGLSLWDRKLRPRAMTKNGRESIRLASQRFYSGAMTQACTGVATRDS